LPSDLGAVQRSDRAFDQLATNAHEGVTVSNPNVISLAGDAVLLEQALKVAGLGAVSSPDVHEDLANRVFFGRDFGMGRRLNDFRGRRLLPSRRR
jgi:hypothetical protein